jgi:hypothetical protein
MQNTGKRCVILLVFIILRWSFNYESNVFRYNKILIDCVFGNSKFVVPSTLTIDLGSASVNSQCLGDSKLAIPSYPVNKYILFPHFLCDIIILRNQYNHASFASILHIKFEYCLMDIFMLFLQSFIRVWFFWESRLQHKFTWWLQVLWKFWIFFLIFEILKSYENFEFF